MWVAPEIRGQGYSRQLCEACIAWAAEHGFPAINLSAKLDNATAIAAYKAAGFEPSHVVEDELVLTAGCDGRQSASNSRNHQRPPPRAGRLA